MEMSGQLHAPAALSQGNCPRCPLDRMVGGLQNRSGRGSEERKKSLPVPGIDLRSFSPQPSRYTESPQLPQDKWKKKISLSQRLHLNLYISLVCNKER